MRLRYALYCYANCYVSTFPRQPCSTYLSNIIHRISKQLQVSSPCRLRELDDEVRETEAAELVVRRSGGNVVRLAAFLGDVVHGLFSSRLVADMEGLVVKSDVAAHQTGQQDVAGLVVERGVDGDPFLLHCDGFEA